MPRKLLIFDLDETLVHATQQRLPQAPCCVHPPYFIYQRPHLAQLLAATQPLYDFAVWSSSSRDYVETVVEQLFGATYPLVFAWVVEQCIQRVHAPLNSYVYVKDLRKVLRHGYGLERIIMLDDSPEKLVRQPRQLLQVRPYLGEPEDDELLTVARRLLEAAV